MSSTAQVCDRVVKDQPDALARAHASFSGPRSVGPSFGPKDWKSSHSTQSVRPGWPAASPHIRARPVSRNLSLYKVPAALFVLPAAPHLQTDRSRAFATLHSPPDFGGF